MAKTNIFLSISTIAVLTLLFTLVTSCAGGEAKEKAEHYFALANEDYDNKNYDQALVWIDSIQQIEPATIEIRRKALTLKQQVSLAQAQNDLATTDSLLTITIRSYNIQELNVKEAREEGNATAEMLESLTLIKLKRDSLKVRCEYLGNKIRYITKEQNEGKAALK